MYADELVALTIADMQVEQMTNAVAVDGTDRASDQVDSDTDGTEEEDDLVYKDSQ